MTAHRMHNVIIHGTRERSRTVYTIRTVFYGSLTWPLLWAVAFIAAELYTSRPGWRSPMFRTGR